MQIKLSARALLDLLIQRIEFATFMKAHGFDRNDSSYGGGNPFHDLSGLTITSARLERCPDEDDDWLVLDFVGEDPAVGPIRNPVPAAGVGRGIAPKNAHGRSTPRRGRARPVDATAPRDG
jgi:hypothetical protein